MKLYRYKGELLASGSQAHKLLEEQKLKELDAHMKKVNEDYHRMRGDKEVKNGKLS